MYAMQRNRPTPATGASITAGPARPRAGLNSAASEIQDWLAASAALEHLEMELIDYVPVYRSPAGTGGGWCFARWT